MGFQTEYYRNHYHYNSKIMTVDSLTFGEISGNSATRNVFYPIVQLENKLIKYLLRCLKLA